MKEVDEEKLRRQAKEISKNYLAKKAKPMTEATKKELRKDNYGKRIRAPRN